jgi:purine-nucleoside phosphorylase
MALSKILEASTYLSSKISVKPKIGIVLGSGLGIYIDQIQNKTIIPYEDIPHFKRTSVEGHSGALIFGEVQGVSVVALQGRLHPYEGYAMEEIVLPVRVLAALGIEMLFLTNASGGINTSFHPGDLVIINDHINLSGRNPLVGPNIAELGPRFRIWEMLMIKNFAKYFSQWRRIITLISKPEFTARSWVLPMKHLLKSAC